MNTRNYLGCKPSVKSSSVVRCVMCDSVYSYGKTSFPRRIVYGGRSECPATCHYNGSGMKHSHRACPVCGNLAPDLWIVVKL